MDSNTEKQQVYRELRRFALAELVCTGLMFGVFALLQKLTGKVLLGGAVGLVLAVLNYVLTAVGVFRAADKAEAGDVAGAQRTIRVSMFGRYGMLIAGLLIGGKSGYCDPIAMVVPLLLARVLISVLEFFRKKD